MPAMQFRRRETNRPGSAHSLVQSQSKFVTSLSSDAWCQLGHGGAPEQLSVRARPDYVKRTPGNAPSRLLRRGDDIPAWVEIETAVTSMTSLERATPARHLASISLPLVSFSQIDSSRHVPTICSLILRACSPTRAASSIAPGGADGCEREAQKHRDRKCSEQVAREGLQCYRTDPAHRVLISRHWVISLAI